MNIHRKIAILAFFLSFLLIGCLGYEKQYLFIDISKKVGEVRYAHIVSDATDEEDMRGDFKDLIDMAYGDETIQEGPGQRTVQIVSRELYGIGSRLDGRLEFTFKDLKAALNEFNIKTDCDGNYFYELGSDESYVRGNGTYTEHNSAKVIKWDRNAGTIELETRSASFEQTKLTSLLSYWLDWKKDK